VPRGPIGRPDRRSGRDLLALFGWFDSDGDNRLSRAEFLELSRFVEERRPRRPDGPPGGPRLGRLDRGDSSLQGVGRFRGFSDRSRRLDGPPRGDRPDRRNRDARPSNRESPPRPPRPDRPPGPGTSRETPATDAI
jgi:hypothetical protein